MSFPVTINISAEVVAWYAGIISTLALIIQLISYIGNKPKVKLKCRRGYRLLSAKSPYKPNTDYIMITAINVGRRPVSMKNVGFITKNKKDPNGLLTDSFMHGIRELTDGKSTDYLIEEGSVDLTKIKYFVAYDLTDREYRGKLKT